MTEFGNANYITTKGISLFFAFSFRTFVIQYDIKCKRCLQSYSGGSDINTFFSRSKQNGTKIGHPVLYEISVESPQNISNFFAIYLLADLVKAQEKISVQQSLLKIVYIQLLVSYSKNEEKSYAIYFYRITCTRRINHQIGAVLI